MYIYLANGPLLLVFATSIFSTTEKFPFLAASSKSWSFPIPRRLFHHFESSDTDLGGKITRRNSQTTFHQSKNWSTLPFWRTYRTCELHSDITTADIRSIYTSLENHPENITHVYERVEFAFDFSQEDRRRRLEIYKTSKRIKQTSNEWKILREGIKFTSFCWVSTNRLNKWRINGEKNPNFTQYRTFAN